MNSTPSRLTAEDRLEIQDLYARYNNAIDVVDAQTWGGCFTPDGIYHGRSPQTGREELIEFALGRPSTPDRMAYENLQHWNNNLVVWPTPEGAEAQVFLMRIAQHRQTKRMEILTIARYVDVLRVHEGRWLFQSRRVVFDMAQPEPIPPAERVSNRGR